MPSKAKEGQKNVTAFVDDDVHLRVRIVMLKRRLTWEQVIDEALREWTARHGRPSKSKA